MKREAIAMGREYLTNAANEMTVRSEPPTGEETFELCDDGIELLNEARNGLNGCRSVLHVMRANGSPLSGGATAPPAASAC
jgi:hypothetical protein